jgi:LysM repeat protein
MTAAIRSTGPLTAIPTGPIPPAYRTSIRRSEAVYRRRRAIVGTTLALFVAVGAVATSDVLAGSGGDPASAAVSLPARTSVIAQPGDTLWSIAAAHHGDASLIRYLDTLVDLNGGPSIQAGQTIVLP